jgi:putative transposase
MRKSLYTEEQIVGILKESEAGLESAELCRKHGISEQRLYRRKAKYGGLEGSDAQLLRQLEEESRKLKYLMRTAFASKLESECPHLYGLAERGQLMQSKPCRVRSRISPGSIFRAG